MMFLSFSGYGIAAQALTAVIKAHDGRGPHTILTSSILKVLGLSSPDEVIGYIYLKLLTVIITYVGKIISCHFGILQSAIKLYAVFGEN